MQTRARLLASLLLGSTLVAGCMRRPVVYPNLQADASAAERDVAVCREQGGSPVREIGGDAVVATLTGALVGAVGGVVSGAVWGNPGPGAAAGAAGGAAASLVSMAIRPYDPGPAYRAMVERCLHERGYQVAAWE